MYLLYCVYCQYYNSKVNRYKTGGKIKSKSVENVGTKYWVWGEKDQPPDHSTSSSLVHTWSSQYGRWHFIGKTWSSQSSQSAHSSGTVDFAHLHLRITPPRCKCGSAWSHTISQQFRASRYGICTRLQAQHFWTEWHDLKKVEIHQTDYAVTIYTPERIHTTDKGATKPFQL